MTIEQTRIREIPYNYTSFSDREIVIRFLGEPMWNLLNTLRGSRRTGRSARMLFEVLGDMWIIVRNPFIQDDLMENTKRWSSLVHALHHRIDQIAERRGTNTLVLKLLDSIRNAVKEFENWLPEQKSKRQKTYQALIKVTKNRNILFDGLSRVSHVTDASDWRVEYPFVVLTPDNEEEIAAIVATCIDLGLSIIPRGGGTGYTGGAIPLVTNCAVINTEKLDLIEKIVHKKLPGLTREVATIRAQAGVVTRRITEIAEPNGYVFAVDPTSQDASTLGGNIAMNAGGKKAVKWGTTLDNLASWRMVTTQAQWIEIERINHNLEKIHEQDFAEFRVTPCDTQGRKDVAGAIIIQIPGTDLRKQGLGKDVTNKFLGGLPGVQKEGCDGFITSAEFILHKSPSFTRTVCLEFFGSDLNQAVPAIIELKNYIDSLDMVYLIGMEHLDERYVKAVNYTTKAPTGVLPKMVLLLDVAGDYENEVAAAASEVVKRANLREAEGFIAVSAQARKQFWSDRSRTAAIAAHTNAFKINEDVVIPLEKLAEYSRQIETINIEQSLKNKLKIIEAAIEFLQSSEFVKQFDFHDSEENQTILASKQNAALNILENTKQLWNQIIVNLDMPAIGFQSSITKDARKELKPNDKLIDLLQRRAIKISYRSAIEHPIKNIFSGREFAPIHVILDKIHADIRISRLFVATHMHAGDGNVHTNIPVNSNDYAMLHEANIIVEKIMALAQSLGGVISGEHGIGITKMPFMEPKKVEEFARYKAKIDPNGHFNRGKLLKNADTRNAYTPSLRLVQQEAIILEASELGLLNDKIKHCLRCGKCKPVCTTHVPRANLLYSPRNKILATGLIIEAFLYEEQTRRGISLRHFDEMNDVADHCTTCHRCLKPCPVDINFGEASIQLRSILQAHGRKRNNLGTRISMAFLNATDPTKIRFLRLLFIKWGYRLQRFAYTMTKNTKLVNPDRQPNLTIGKVPIAIQAINLVKKPMPNDIARKTMRAYLGIEETKHVPIIRNPKKVTDETEAVFYFPGCGSERLFSQVSLATLAVLYDLGVQTVLPPGYLCCGYPQISVGDQKKGDSISIDNQVLFHRVANTLNYLDIKTVLVSCGTCIDQLEKYRFENIFPGSRLLDIHEYAMEKGLRLTNTNEKRYLYHDPCHTPMKKYDALKVVSTLTGQDVKLTDRCCGEAGTFGVSRPDIATQVRFRKKQELLDDISQIRSATPSAEQEIKILTSCPSCQQGLSRYRDDTGLSTDYIVVELAQNLFGKDWQKTFIAKIQKGGIERILL